MFTFQHPAEALDNGSLLQVIQLVILKVDCNPVSILHKSIAGRYRPVRVADGPITARCRFIKNASWVNT